ncbi:MAG TPA: ParB N-terminal domain-containing protein, partial [bacterium]|nr:ParB N-terminal domain-containing protein [bacterium]
MTPENTLLAPQAGSQKGSIALPAGFPYALNQEVEIPLDQMIPNPQQPRRSMRKDTLEELAASMQVKGQEVAAPVRPLTEEERIAHPGVWVMLIGGHRRRQAALMNQFETLKCLVKGIGPKETHHAAVTDNLHEEMDWWDWDLAIEKEAQLTGKTQVELIGWMGKSKGKIYKAITITQTLNEAARALVDENLEKTLKND